MRKSTYETRMKSYIGMLITFGLGMLLVSIIAQLQLDLNNSGHYALQLPAIQEMDEIEVAISDEYEDEEYAEEYTDELVESEYEDEEYTEEDILVEINPDDYDGKIVIATADEVITMTTDDDGTKRFTNHIMMG